MALKISKFGGDPAKVTIWGESAGATTIHMLLGIEAIYEINIHTGAGSVIQHLVANGGQTKPQLFRAAITSSTYFPSQYNYSDRIPEVRDLLKYWNGTHPTRRSCTTAKYWHKPSA
jgi:hypothetical protein